MNLLSGLLCAFGVPLLTGAAGLAVFGRRRGHVCPQGMLFHAVTRGRSPFFSHYTPENLRRFLEEACEKEYVATSVRGIAAVNVLRCRRQFVLAFDDGFADFFDQALPVLSELGVTASVFPIVSVLGGSSTWDVFPSRRHLSAAQLREISAMGHEVGSHTMTHADLTFLDDRNLERELADSKRMLEDIVGREVVTLSFPCGRWNLRVWSRARELGYRAAAAYGGARRGVDGIVPLVGAYAFDTPSDLLRRLGDSETPSNAVARGCVMPHFAKGTSLWKFRREYRLTGRGRRRAVAEVDV